MNIEAPPIARRLFWRLCKGDNLLLSRNGPSEDAEFFELIEADEAHCRDYFQILGLKLQRGDNIITSLRKMTPRPI
ncbi:MAG: hypothetical protein ACXWIU_15980 [Limisphaerales bacterium]